MGEETNAVKMPGYFPACNAVVMLKIEARGAFHLVKISGISGSAVNGTLSVGSFHWKIPRKSGKSKKVVPFSRLEFPNGMSCSIDLSCSLYQFQVHGRAPGHVPGFTTKWNNFLPIKNSTFATTEISGFFLLNGKCPLCPFTFQTKFSPLLPSW